MLTNGVQDIRDRHACARRGGRPGPDGAIAQEVVDPAKTESGHQRRDAEHGGRDHSTYGERSNSLLQCRTRGRPVPRHEGETNCRRCLDGRRERHEEQRPDRMSLHGETEAND